MGFSPVTGRKIRCGLIGTGGIAAVHARSYAALSDQAELVAICDINAARASAFAAEHGVAHVLTDYSALLARTDIDMIDICTPPLVHAEIMLAALHAGKPVLCEKPFAASLAEIDAVIAAEAETGTFTACISQLRWGTGLQQIQAMRRENILSDPLWGICETAWYRDDSYYAVDWRGRWDNELGGVTLGLGVHAIDTFITVMGKPVAITAMAGTLNHDIQVEDTSAAAIRFASGAIGQVLTTANCHRQFSRQIFGFRNATAESDEAPYLMTDPPYRISATDAAVQQRIDAVQAGWQVDPTPGPIHSRQIAEFLACVRGERTPTVTAREARVAFEVITGLYKSAFTSQHVTFPITKDDSFYTALHGGYAGALTF